MKFSAVLFASFLLAGGLMGHRALSEESAAGGTQAYLGIGVSPLHPALTNQLPGVIGKGRGVLVEKVMKGSPAEKAGLRQYDVLVRLNKQDLYAPEQLVKLIRNATPGSVARLVYVRGGQVHESKVALGETPAQAPVRAKRGFWLPFIDRFVHPRQSKPDQQKPEQARPQATAPRTPWATFESMTITKQDDGSYKVRIDYRDGEKKQIHREYVGTREEIKKAIQADKDLPAAERQHLLRSLDKHEQPHFALPLLGDWERELFNWPNLDF